jgi:subtilisin-like proprotein convertase family protein
MKEETMRNFCLILLCLGLAACSPNTETPTPSPESTVLSCETIVEISLNSLETACNDVGRNEVCYGSRLINVQLREGDNNVFNEPGDRIPIQSVETLSLSPMDEAKGEWGFALMQIQADLPDTLPGQNLTFLLFGGTEISPQGEVDGLQAFYVKTGMGATSACNDVPEDGLLIQSPDGDVEVAFSLNGVRFQLGSTAYITADESMHVQLLEGQAVLSAVGETQTVSAGEESSVPLDNSGQAIGAPTIPEPYEPSNINRLPLTILPRPIEASSEIQRRATATPSLDLSDNPIADFGTADNPDRGIISGEIMVANEIDVHTFESTGNQAIYIDAQTMEGDIRINLTSPSEELLLNQHWLGTDYGTLLLEEAGVYSLEIKGHDESTGAYQLQFWNVPEPKRFTARLSAAVPDNQDGIISGQLLSPAAKDIYEIVVEAGQNIFLDAQTMEGDVRASLVSPTDVILLNQHWLGTDAEPIALEEAGTYRLEVAGYLDSIGTYQVQLWEVPDPVQGQAIIAHATPNNEEGVISGEIQTPASRYIYTFTASAGQRILLDAQVMEGDIRATITSPDGTVLLDEHWLGIDSQVITLPERGSYTLEIYGYFAAVGTYQVQLWDVPDSIEGQTVIAEAIPDNQEGIVSGELLTPASRYIYEFTGVAGQTIFLDAHEMEGDIRATITSPDGTILLNAHWLGIDSEILSLPERGSYTLEVFGNLDSVGSYELQLWDVPIPESSEITIAPDAESREGLITGQILSPATSHIYTFEANVGQVVYLAMISLEGDIRVTLTSPDGEILMNSMWLGTDSQPMRLETTGQYTIHIHGNLDALGSYEYQLRAVAR